MLITADPLPCCLSLMWCLNNRNVPDLHLRLKIPHRFMHKHPCALNLALHTCKRARLSLKAHSPALVWGKGLARHAFLSQACMTCIIQPLWSACLPLKPHSCTHAWHHLCTQCMACMAVCMHHQLLDCSATRVMSFGAQITQKMRILTRTIPPPDAPSSPVRHQGFWAPLLTTLCVPLHGYALAQSTSQRMLPISSTLQSRAPAELSAHLRISPKVRDSSKRVRHVLAHKPPQKTGA